MQGRRAVFRSALAALAGVIVLCLIDDPPSAQGGQPDLVRPTFRAGVETVVIAVTVRDRSGHLVASLDRGDFRLLVDGRSVKIEVFSHERQSLMLGILLSTSVESGVERMRDVGRGLVEAIESTEYAAIGTYSNEIAISPFATSDRTILHRVLDEEVWPGFNNPVNAAVATMISGMPKDRGKPVLVVAGSDFAETCGPCISEAHARQAAQSEGVAVYGIVNRTREPPTQIGSFPVAKLSEATGGGYVLLKSGDDIRSLMKQVTEELRHEYLLGFTPAVADGRQHTVTVEVVRPHHRAMARVRDSRRRK